MAKYYAAEISALRGQAMTAGSKARDDVEEILEAGGFKRLEITQSIDLKLDKKGSHLPRKLARRLIAKHDWGRALASLAESDVIAVQLPIRNHSRAAARFISELGKREGVRVVCIVHDLEMFRLSESQSEKRLKREELVQEELALLRGAYRAIVHNEKMLELIETRLGGDVAAKCVQLGCFDYLVDGTAVAGEPVHNKGDGIAIAGNLSEEKAGYVYELPKVPDFHLYGINYKQRSEGNVEYCGAYDPDELPLHLDGGFGLVWDGPSVDSCEGVYGEYLRINNPHKVSLYLASGLPIIIWEQAAMAGFVTEMGAGFAVSSLDEIASKVNAITEGDYSRMKSSAEAISEKVRSGWFLHNALTEALR